MTRMESKMGKVSAVLCDLDCLGSELEDVEHLLVLLDEGLSEDLEPLQRGESWGGKYLLDRWPMYCSVLNVIRCRMANILRDMQEGVNKGYEAIGTQT